MSPRFWTILGYDPADKKDLVSEWQDLINPEDLQMVLSNFAKHCKDPNYPYDQVVRYRHKNGSTVWVRCRGIAIRDQKGKPIRLLGAHTDLTKLKMTEEKVRQRTIELEETNKKHLATSKNWRGFFRFVPAVRRLGMIKAIGVRLKPIFGIGPMLSSHIVYVPNVPKNSMEIVRKTPNDDPPIENKDIFPS